MATTWQQVTARGRNDDGSESAATWIAAAGTNFTLTVPSGAVTCRLRIQTRETGTTAATLTGRLYVAKNGGSYAQASSTSTSGCKVVDSANLTDDAATTQQLGGTPFVAGKVDDVNGQTSATGSIAPNSYTEHEFVLQFDYANLTNGDYFDFRMRASTTAYGTYTYTPRITVAKTLAPSGDVGYKTIGANATGTTTAGHGVLNKITLTETLNLTALGGYLVGNGASVKFLLHADNAGNPGNQLAISAPVSLGASLAWLTGAISYSAVPGDYWSGWVTDTTLSGMTRYDASVSGANEFDAVFDSYASPGNNPTGTLNAGVQVSAYLSYDNRGGSANGSLAGASLTATASLSAGSMKGGAKLSGAALSATASLTAGTVKGGAKLAGASLTGTASLSAGTLKGSAKLAGATFGVTASLVPGSLGVRVVMPGATLTATSSISVGSLKGAAKLTGQNLTSTASISSGAMTGSGKMAGVSLSATATLTPGALKGSARMTGQSFAVSSSLSAGSLKGSARLPGASLSATASLVAGALKGSARLGGSTLTAAAVFLPGVLFNPEASVIPGQSFAVTASLVPGSMSASGRMPGASFSRTVTLSAGGLSGSGKLSGAQFDRAASLSAGTLRAHGVLRGFDAVITTLLEAGTWSGGARMPGAEFSALVAFVPGQLRSGFAVDISTHNQVPVSMIEMLTAQDHLISITTGQESLITQQLQQIG